MRWTIAAATLLLGSLIARTADTSTGTGSPAPQPSSPQSTSPIATIAIDDNGPAMLANWSGFSDGGLFFVFPDAWHRFNYGWTGSMGGPLVYLSNAKLRDPCKRSPGSL